MTDNPVRTLATLALAACLALGLATPADAAPTAPTASRCPDAPTSGRAPTRSSCGTSSSARPRPARAPSSARAALPRPDWDPSLPQGRACTDLVCVHYVAASGDAPPMASSTGGTPDWVTLTLHHRRRESFARMTQLGWPLPPERPRRGRHRPVRRLPAGPRPAGPLRLLRPGAARARRAQRRVVVLRARQRLRRASRCPPTPSMRVTVGPRALPRRAVRASTPREDGWFLEATATWMEEQITDDVNDNRQYLRHGQLGDPGTPLDTFDCRPGLLRQLDLLPAPQPAASAPRRSARSGRARTGTWVARNDFSVRAVRRYVESRGVSWPAVLRRLRRRQPHRPARRTTRGRPTEPRRAAGQGPARPRPPHLVARASPWTTSRGTCVSLRPGPGLRGTAACASPWTRAVRPRRPGRARGAHRSPRRHRSQPDPARPSRPRLPGREVPPPAGAPGRAWCWPTPRPATPATAAPSSPATAASAR